ncbi:SLAP domain-containing protein [Siminovitchia acidinfaciens]|nr:SLAP domain-containing protein [Siminovitchia acidinfaciens]
MSKLSFHPVWEHKLTNEQKKEFMEILNSLPPSEIDLEAVPVRGKYKKNGGVVATVLLRNSSHEPLDIKCVKVEITDHENEVIATESFAPDLHIEADSAMPWSFVFAKESVQKRSVDSINWKLNIYLPEIG